MGQKFYVGENCPKFAESYDHLEKYFSSLNPQIPLSDDDEAAIYFSSGTRIPEGDPPCPPGALFSCEVEQAHHGQRRGDCFLCSPAALSHRCQDAWFGSLLSGSRAVLLRGVKPEWILRRSPRSSAPIVWLLVRGRWISSTAIDAATSISRIIKLDQWRLMHIGARRCRLFDYEMGNRLPESRI